MTEEPDRDEVPAKKTRTKVTFGPGLHGLRPMTEADGMIFAGGLLLAGMVGFGWLIWKVMFQGVSGG